MKRMISVLLCVFLLAALFALPAQAVEKVTLTYDLMYNGLVCQQTVTKGEVPIQQYFERDGYELYICYEDAAFKKKFDFSRPLNENKTIYVRWLTEDELVYVAFYLHADAPEATAYGVCAKGEAFGSPADPGQTGEVFAGWYLNRACTIPYNPTEKLYNDIEIFACYVDSQDEVTGYNIFDSPGDDEPVAGGYIKKGGYMFMPGSPPMDEDETLLGWYFDRALTREIDFSQPITDDYIYLFPNVVADDDVYWIGIYLDAEDEYPVGYGAAEKGKPIPQPEEPGRGDEVFAGWYTDRALTQPADFTAPWYEDVDLFPRWEEVHYHNLVDVAEIPATATTDGLGAHMLCTGCGKWFEATPVALIEIADHESIVIPATGPYRLGDANGDGVVNVRDVTAVQRYLAQYEPMPFCRAAANVISSDGLNINDLTKIQMYLAEFIHRF